MPRPALRTHSKAKIKTRTPGGRTSLHIRPRKTKKARCSICGKPLHGTHVGLEAKKMALSEKRPNRPYGGYICSTCLSNLISAKVRALY
ncbi:MAG: 50S ribosomal protein L34e [Thermoprotei archaeon]